MATVELRNVSKRYGGTEVLRELNLDIADGELVVLVGPSGCGKSTLLRMLCGLEEVSGGEILVDGTVVNDKPPAERGIAMVFQSYALYPHMSVFRNMAFGLKIHGAGREERKRRVHAAAKALQIEHLLDRLPRELSGGQRQRVAIGRAIVREPKLFLFDEPLSNLDAALRVKTRIELARLHRELHATMVYVTHDQVEAMTLGDKIVVMHEGRIQQAGTPLELYQRPANRFVAGFIGSPTINLLPGRVAGIDAAEIGIRPEHLRPAGPGLATDAGLRLSGEVVLVEQLGESHLVYLRSAQGDELVMRGSGQTVLRPGDPIEVTAAAETLLRFDAEGRALPSAFGQGDPM